MNAPARIRPVPTEAEKVERLEHHLREALALYRSIDRRAYEQATLNLGWHGDMAGIIDAAAAVRAYRVARDEPTPPEHERLSEIWSECTPSRLGLIEEGDL